MFTPGHVFLLPVSWMMSLDFDDVKIGVGRQRFVEELKKRIATARITVARRVNCVLILLYWEIGRKIVEKQKLLGWGKSVVEMIASDLRRSFPDMRGFSPDSIWRMLQFYAEYAEHSILEQLVPELLGQVPWGHHIEILKKVKTHHARLWYIRATSRFGWSRNVPLNQIKAKTYERAVLEKKTLRTKSNPISVAVYQLGSDLPEELKGKLPTTKQVADIILAEMQR